MTSSALTTSVALAVITGALAVPPLTVTLVPSRGVVPAVHTPLPFAESLVVHARVPHRGVAPWD